MSSIAGQMVTETFDYDGGRQVTVYVPPEPTGSVVFAGDGGWHTSRLGEMVESGGSVSTMIVGVHGLADDDARLKEYSPVFNEQRFAAHEKFFVEGVRSWVRSRFKVDLPAERTAVWGASAGGECQAPWHASQGRGRTTVGRRNQTTAVRASLPRSMHRRKVHRRGTFIASSHARRS